MTRLSLLLCNRGSRAALREDCRKSFLYRIGEELPVIRPRLNGRSNESSGGTSCDSISRHYERIVGNLEVICPGSGLVLESRHLASNTTSLLARLSLLIRRTNRIVPGFPSSGSSSATSIAPRFPFPCFPSFGELTKSYEVDWFSACCFNPARHSANRCTPVSLTLLSHVFLRHSSFA